MGLLANVSLSNGYDEWSWNLDGSSSFIAKEMRRYIDSISLPDGRSGTRWCSSMPRKLNNLH